MKIRVGINHSYSIIALRRKRRLVAVASAALACATFICIAIESGMPTAIKASELTSVRQNDQQTASSLASGRSTGQVVNRVEASFRNRRQ
jgi:hypothetical protein